MYKESDWVMKDPTQEDFYTAKPVKVDVTEKEFYEFINNYPRKLECDINGMCEPPSVSFNDFELANLWPYSIVAKTHKYSDNPNDWAYVPVEDRRWTIVANHEELFASKTGFKA